MDIGPMTFDAQALYVRLVEDWGRLINRPPTDENRPIWRCAVAELNELMIVVEAIGEAEGWFVP